MRRMTWLLLAMVGLAILPGLGPQDAAPSPLTASQILQRVEQTYARARSYRDAGVVVNTLAQAHPADEHDAAPFGRHVTPFRTVFVRPGGFRFECGPSSDDMHGRFLVWRSGADVRTWSEDPRDVAHATTLGAATVVASFDSSEVSLRIPKLLVPLEILAANLCSELAQAVRLEDVSSDGIACFCVKGLLMDHLQRFATCTAWIDQQSFLLRRTEMRVENFGVIDTTTATYEPEIDVDIGPGELLFDPPKVLKPSAREQEAARVRASSPPSLSEAQMLSIKGKHDEALIEFDRLWNTQTEADWQDQPLSDTESRLVAAIGREAAEHPPTRQHFEKAFDALDTEVRGGAASTHDWSRWIELGHALKLDDRILQLYVERRSPEGTLRAYADMDPFAMNVLEDILVERKQFGDAGRLCIDPVKQARWNYRSVAISTADLVGKKGMQRVIDEMTASARKATSRLHALTLAAGRTNEADQIAAAMLESDDSVEARRALIAACLDCGVRSDWIPGWLAEIRKSGGEAADLEARLTPSTGASDAGADGR